MLPPVTPCYTPVTLCYNLSHPCYLLIHPCYTPATTCYLCYTFLIFCCCRFPFPSQNMHSKCPCPIVSLSRTFWIIFVLYSQFRIIWYILIGCFLCIWCLFAFFSFPELSPVLPAAALVVGIRPTPVITCCKEHSLSLKNIYFVQNLKKTATIFNLFKKWRGEMANSWL